MFFSFNSFDTQENCQIIIQLGNQIIENTTLPLTFAQQNFINIVQQLAKDERPMQIKCIRDYEIESGKILKNMLIFSNNAFVRAFGGKI